MLEELKKQVVKYALQADRSGLCKHRSGNFSVRDPKTGYVCITPTGMDREEMTYHDVVVIDLDANVIEAETAQRRPTSESLMHLEVYKQHPDINAVAHTGAGLFYLSGGGEWNPLNSTSLPAMGFNGIATALLANSNPIGTIFSSLFISHISVGGLPLPADKPESHVLMPSPSPVKMPLPYRGLFSYPAVSRHRQLHDSL